MKTLQFLLKKQFSWLEIGGIALTSLCIINFGVWWILLVLLFTVIQRIGEVVVEDVK